MARATRRDLLRIGLLLGVAGLVMARPWQGLRQPDLAFEDIADLPPLRRLIGAWEEAGGNAGNAVLIGLEPPGAERSSPPEGFERLRRDICTVLDLSWPPGGVVPVTYFTDINCPSCRQLEADLAALSDDASPGFRLMTREYPVFGARSEAAAQVVRAAARQGGAEDVRRHLRTRRAPDTHSGVAALAMQLDLAPDDMVDAWMSVEVAESLREDRTLARLLAIPGTPGLVVGRTVVVGALPRDRLTALIGLERNAGAPARCA